jgi:hypothetical protein
MRIQQRLKHLEQAMNPRAPDFLGAICSDVVTDARGWTGIEYRQAHVKDAEEQFYPRLTGESLPDCYARTAPGDGWIHIYAVPGQPGVLTADEWAGLKGPKQ